MSSSALTSAPKLKSSLTIFSFLLNLELCNGDQSLLFLALTSAPARINVSKTRGLWFLEAASCNAVPPDAFLAFILDPPWMSNL